MCAPPTAFDVAKLVRFLYHHPPKRPKAFGTTPANEHRRGGLLDDDHAGSGGQMLRLPMATDGGVSSAGVSGPVPRITSLLIKPASAVCNLDCDYCFYLDRAADPYQDRKTRTMSPATLERLVAGYLAYSCPMSAFSFQGGEPTLAGIDFFKRLVELQLAPWAPWTDHRQQHSRPTVCCSTGTGANLSRKSVRIPAACGIPTRCAIRVSPIAWC